MARAVFIAVQQRQKDTASIQGAEMSSLSEWMQNSDVDQA